MKLFRISSVMRTEIKTRLMDRKALFFGSVLQVVL
jgi:hypothetical protein